MTKRYSTSNRHFRTKQEAEEYAKNITAESYGVSKHKIVKTIYPTKNGYGLSIRVIWNR